MLDELRYTVVLITIFINDTYVEYTTILINHIHSFHCSIHMNPLVKQHLTLWRIEIINQALIVIFFIQKSRFISERSRFKSY